MTPATQPATDIVLLGGGHAHVHVMKAFAMRPEPGVRLTLVARELETPYSGMLPGLIAGLYTHDDAHIDLVRLCAATGTRLIHAEAVGLDRGNKRVRLAGRAPIAYDFVSFDVGIAPDISSIAGAEHAVAVKPIGLFLQKFEALLARCRAPDRPRALTVIGGGAGGVELLLSIRARILAEVGPAANAFMFALTTDGEILATHHPRVRAAFRRILKARGIALHEHCRARTIEPGRIVCESGNAIAADAVLLTTQAAAPAWFATTGLALDAQGFLQVTPTLQSADDPDVFAAGDCAALPSPREKSGVFAVRAGPWLAGNLRRRPRGDALRAWHPQRRQLALISSGERYAVASRGAFKAEGAWLWMVKDFIDRRWMRMYQQIDPAKMRAPASAPSASPSDDDMRCGGCAAKVGPGPLSRALARLDRAPFASGVLVGLNTPDDAAVLAAPSGKHVVQTVDFFRAFIDDPFLFGKIAANHALNDVFAMGGEPRHALATAVVPPGPPAKVEEMLFQLLAGARATFDATGVALVGGHSSEGAELAIGFSVSGDVAPDRVLRKAGLQTDQVLILTRPLGTGVLFAAAMRARARASWVEAALAEMQRSNSEASRILVAHGASAMTDVSGFGLAGHLGEMLSASGAAADVTLQQIPLYEGAAELVRLGLHSTLLAENLTLAGLLRGNADDVARALLFDPQTAGGLLAGVPAERADDCVGQLHAAGYTHAAVIGRVSRVNLAARDVAITVG
jgi:selenide,water dikinase